MGNREDWRLGNRSGLIRFIGSLALLSVGSYLLAEGLSNLILLPFSVGVAGLSGSQEASQVQAWRNQFVIQLAFGIFCLAGSLFVAFFKFETLRPHVLQSPLTTQETFEEVRSSFPHTRVASQESFEENRSRFPKLSLATHEPLEEVRSGTPESPIVKRESAEEVKAHAPQPLGLTQESVKEIKLRLKKLQFIDSNLARKVWDALPKDLQNEIRNNPAV